MSAARDRRPPRPASLARRLRPLQVGAGLQGFMLWVPVEKLFQTQIGLRAAYAVHDIRHARINALPHLDNYQGRAITN